MNFVLAHEGGWDELLLVAVPLVILALLLVVATTRAKRIAGEPADGPSAGAEEHPENSP